MKISEKIAENADISRKIFNFVRALGKYKDYYKRTNFLKNSMFPDSLSFQALQIMTDIFNNIQQLAYKNLT